MQDETLSEEMAEDAGTPVSVPASPEGEQVEIEIGASGGEVFVLFSQAVGMLSMSPTGARGMARALLKHAARIDGRGRRTAR